MKAKYLKKYWENVDVTILTDGIDRVENTNTISDRYGDADLVYDPGHNLPHEDGIMQVVLCRRGNDVYTLKTGCKCGEYDIFDPKVIHHFVHRIDAMVEIAAKMGAPTIYTDQISELDDHLVEKLTDAGVTICKPEFPKMPDEGNSDPDLV